MEFVATPGDVTRLAQAARQIDANPVRLAGRLLGLGADEQAAGVPGWAWLALAIGLGAYLGDRYGGEVRERLGL